MLARLLNQMDERIRQLQNQIDNDVMGRCVIGEMRKDYRITQPTIMRAFNLIGKA